MPPVGWKKISEEELRLAKKWFAAGVTPADIAERLGRDKSTVTRRCVKMLGRKRQGRKKALSEAQVDFLERRLEQLIVKAKGRYHVTAKMFKRSTRMKVSARCISDALHKRNVYFRKLREKPMLTIENRKARMAFACKFKGKTKGWWNAHVHAFIDGEHFQVYLNGKERLYAAQHATYGAYRKPGKGLSGAYVKPKRTLKRNTGARSALVMAGIGRGRCLMWHEVFNSRWNGAVAEHMYKQPLAKALRKTWAEKRRWTVLEDNDPTGFKSGAARRAKIAVNITTFAIPPRSPDLNPCDFALWKEINKRMRKQELQWKSSRRESREQYLHRLKRTATRLPRNFIEGSVGDMARRCKRLHDAQGGYFEEGGKGQ